MYPFSPRQIRIPIKQIYRKKQHRKRHPRRPVNFWHWIEPGRSLFLFLHPVPLKRRPVARIFVITGSFRLILRFTYAERQITPCLRCPAGRRRGNRTRGQGNHLDEVGIPAVDVLVVRTRGGWTTLAGRWLLLENVNSYFALKTKKIMSFKFIRNVYNFILSFFLSHIFLLYVVFKYLGRTCEYA